MTEETAPDFSHQSRTSVRVVVEDPVGSDAFDLEVRTATYLKGTQLMTDTRLVLRCRHCDDQMELGPGITAAKLALLADRVNSHKH